VAGLFFPANEIHQQENSSPLLIFAAGLFFPALAGKCFPALNICNRFIFSCS
jgi:hypothetical protein